MCKLSKKIVIYSPNRQPGFKRPGTHCEHPMLCCPTGAGVHVPRQLLQSLNRKQDPDRVVFIKMYYITNN